MDTEDLRKEFLRKIADMGGRAFKQNRLQGFPEMMVIIPGGLFGFVEIIPESERVPEIVRNRIKDLRTLGCAACRLSEEKEIDSVIMYILTRAGKDPDFYRFKIERRRLETESHVDKELEPC